MVRDLAPMSFDLVLLAEFGEVLEGVAVEVGAAVVEVGPPVCGGLGGRSTLLVLRDALILGSVDGVLVLVDEPPVVEPFKSLNFTLGDLLRKLSSPSRSSSLISNFVRRLVELDVESSDMVDVLADLTESFTLDEIEVVSLSEASFSDGLIFSGGSLNFTVLTTSVVVVDVLSKLSFLSYELKPTRLSFFKRLAVIEVELVVDKLFSIPLVLSRLVFSFSSGMSLS